MKKNKTPLYVLEKSIKGTSTVKISFYREDNNEKRKLSMEGDITPKQNTQTLYLLIQSFNLYIQIYIQSFNPLLSDLHVKLLPLC